MPIEKIIVLEDDLIVRKNLEQQLRQRRYDVASTGTIAGAQEFLAKDTFDLIFVDVRLPDGEGTELLRQLQSRPQRPLVVMVTGFGSVESAVECMRNGAFDAQAVFGGPVGGDAQEGGEFQPDPQGQRVFDAGGRGERS